MSGFYMLPKDEGGHQAVPVKDSWRTEDGRAASLLTGPYPVIAVCQTCQGAIRLSHRLQMEWHHVSAVSKP